MTERHDVEFDAAGGVTLRGWLFLPDGPGPHPGITMAHGYAGVKEHGLERFARAFADDGFVVLAHDHRGFGASDGEPGRDVDPWGQIADWRRAISFLERRAEVDPERIGLWGTSYAGGHAIVLGATDRRLRCVVAQVPTISGYEQGLRRVAPDDLAALEAAFAEDERAQARGEPPRYQAVVSDDPDVVAAYRAPEAIEFYRQPVPEGTWENTVTVRSTRAARMYEPGVWIGRVSPTPLLTVVALNDTIALTDLALAAYERALEPKRLELVPGGHFAPYLSGFRPRERRRACVVPRAPHVERAQRQPSDQIPNRREVRMPHLTHSTEDGVATLTLSNPPQNRIDEQMAGELADALDAVIRSDARAVLLRSDGSDFSFGGDITPWPGQDVRELRRLFERHMSVFNQLERLPLPVIAAVHGLCFGGGFELALRADVIFAAESARFGHPEQTLGIVTLLGGIYRVAERAGRSRASEWALTSEQVPATVMAGAGVVNRVVADEALMQEATAFAHRVAKGPTRAYAVHKVLLRAWAEGGVPAADEVILDIALPLFETEDVKSALPLAFDALTAGRPRPAFDFQGR